VGHWVGTFTSSTVVSAGHGMTLTQSGSQATGDLRMTGLFDPSGPIQVTVSGNTAHIIRPSKLTGTVTVQGDSMNGVIGGSVRPRNNTTYMR
jgi:hypothetical protein